MDCRIAYFAKKERRVKPVFDIAGEAGKTDAVLCEWGETYCCVAAYDREAGILHSLRYFTLEGKASVWEVNAVLDALQDLGGADMPLILCAAFPEAVLVPKKFYSADAPYLPVIHDSPGQPLADHVGEWQLVNTYAVPALIRDGVAARFSSVRYYHAFTPCLKVYNGIAEPDQVDLHFSPSQFRLVVKRGGQLVLAQMYRYQAPLDVVYYLLKIFGELGLPRDQTVVVVSGLVEESSGLYSELHQFVPDLRFAPSPTISLQSDQPAHFFTSLSNLAACAS
ncbi:MAG: hypothetical protein JWP27_1074 [Flaviaesturariibacter sp.]|nr:hypothetical protein [Flaviaesturariibacter sp.]